MSYSDIGKVYSDGEVIFKEGDKGENMFVIQSGKVRITKKTDSGDMTIAILDTGELFGEMALFDKLPRSANATAVGEARILNIDKKKFFSNASRDPSMVFKILETTSMRIRKLDDEFTKLKKSRLDVLHACMDVDETCKLILDEAKNIINTDNGSIMIFDDNKKTLTIKSAFGDKAGDAMEFAVGEGIAGDVLKTGKAELVNNVSLDSRFVKGGARIHSMLCAPLKGKGNIFGVINLSNSSEKMFTIENLKILHTLAIYASVAILNAKSFSKLSSAAEDVLMHASLLDM
ncbi:MAG: cyclic nucleotide-binding domain-containing protein [Thermodesulfovibrionia bacterium]|nr:cyclic nucleotide-binding domain-containing protein [Thermodesulfovibrionia bacterium]